MSDIKNSIINITSLEELSLKDTPIHRKHPTVKLLITLIYLVIVISFPTYEVSGLLPMVFFPILWMVIGEIPFRPLFGRLLIALPFTLFAGLSNVLISREEVLQFGTLIITGGMLGFTSIMLKTILTVMAVLILIATTSMKELLQVMVQLKVPPIVILQLTMTFRYLELLMEEALVMYHAYMLRSPGARGIKLKDMGPFLGQLILKSFGRAERVYYAMKCRGFAGKIRFSEHRKINFADLIYLVLITLLLILLRLVNISEIIGSFIISI